MGNLVSVIRNLTFKVDSGFNRQYWGFEQKGNRAAGMPKAGGGGGRRMMEEAAADPDEEREFRGRDVVAGKYKVVVTANNKKDSMWIEVKDDARLMDRNPVVKKQDELLAKHQPSADKFNSAMDQLDEVDALLLNIFQSVDERYPFVANPD